MSRVYEMSHLVSFEETNVVGNVYFANYILWQGRCRELFLAEYAPSVISQVEGGLKLFTLSVNCEFLAELQAFDRVDVKMSLAELTQTQIEFSFEYYRGGPQELLVAVGRQRVVCMRGDEVAGLNPVRVPDELRRALMMFR